MVDADALKLPARGSRSDQQLKATMACGFHLKLRMIGGEVGQGYE
jgi:hypothetical protein